MVLACAETSIFENSHLPPVACATTWSVPAPFFPLSGTVKSATPSPFVSLKLPLTPMVGDAGVPINLATSGLWFTFSIASLKGTLDWIIAVTPK